MDRLGYVTGYRRDVSGSPAETGLVYYGYPSVLGLTLTLHKTRTLVETAELARNWRFLAGLQSLVVSEDGHHLTGIIGVQERALVGSGSAQDAINAGWIENPAPCGLFYTLDLRWTPKTGPRAKL